jgi:hypothetical protein
MNIVELKEKNISELTQMAKQYKIEGAASTSDRKKRFHFRRRNLGDFAGRVWVFEITGFKLFTGSG